MKKILFQLFFLLATTSIALAQTEPCKTMQLHDKLYHSDPNYRVAYESQKTISTNPNARIAATGVYRIPVVIHVMHLGTAVGTGANISDEQIYSAIESLNNAYRKKAGTANYGNGEDAEMEFCLAQLDPNGNPHSGINRVNASAIQDYSNYGITNVNEINIKALSKWSNTKYYNIWIVAEIDSNNGGSGTQGYAYFPGAGPSLDGAVMLYNAFGFDADGSRGYNLKSYTNRNITVIHELGHAFNLYHTFQGDGTGNTCPANTSCGTSSDCVDDTPPHKRSNSDCLTGDNECTNPVTPRDLFIHNYMDYSSDACQNEFTAGQVTRMRAALASGPRAALVTTSNLIACGCNGNAAPIPRFTVFNTQPCKNIPVQFTDESIDFPAAWLWTFQGGTPSTSHDQNPSVLFSGSGPYTVSLTSTSYGNISKTITKTALISPTTTVTTPFSENFESGLMPPAGWQRVSSDDVASNITWASISTGGNGSSTKSAYVNCYLYNSPDETDDLITPPISLEGITNPSLSFKVSYTVYQTFYDTLDVDVSTDCGEHWANLYKKYGSALETSSAKGSASAPSNSSQWRTESINLSAYMDATVLVRFRVVNEYGANIYLDDVSVQGTGYQPPVPDFSASDTVGLPSDNISFTDNSYGVINSYSWDFGQDASLAAGTSGQGPHTVSYSTAGFKTVSLTVTNPDGESNTTTKTSYIDIETSFPAPVADFTASLTTQGINQPIVFTNTSTGALSSFSWSFGQGASLPDGTTGAGPFTVSYSSIGFKTVALTVTNPAGDSDTETKISYINITGATEVLAGGLTTHEMFLYPNPAEKYVQLRNVPAGAKLAMINPLGATVRSEASDGSGDQKIDLAGIPAGMYTVLIQTGENVYSERLVIQP